MLSNKEKLQILQDCVAQLHEFDAMQQTALGNSDACWDNHCRITQLIDDFTDDIAKLQEDLENDSR